VLEQQALAAVEAKLQDTSSVQGVALILQEVQNLQRMQATHYDQAREQAEPAGALLNQALEALETAEAMSGAGRLGFGLQTAADPPSPASHLPPWVAGPHYNAENPLLATEAVLLVPGGFASKLTSALNPRRTAVTVTIRNASRSELVQSDGRAQGRRSETVELIRPVAGSADDGEPAVVDTGFGLLSATFVLDPPQGGGAARGEEDPSSSSEGPSSRKKRLCVASGPRPLALGAAFVG